MIGLLAGAHASAKNNADEAAEHFQRATRSFNLTHYDAAIAEFELGYNARPDPRFLYDIAQAHRLAGHFEKAIRFYENYLRLVPETPLRQAIENRIDELHGRIAIGRPASEPFESTPIVHTPAIVAPDEKSPGNPALTRTGLILMVAGVAVAAAGGIGFGVAAARQGSAIDDQARNHVAYDPALEAAGHRYDTLSIVSYLVGGAIAVTGVALALLGRAGRSTAVLPSLARSSAAFSWGVF